MGGLTFSGEWMVEVGWEMKQERREEALWLVCKIKKKKLSKQPQSYCVGMPLLKLVL